MEFGSHGFDLDKNRKYFGSSSLNGNLEIYNVLSVRSERQSRSPKCQESIS